MSGSFSLPASSSGSGGIGRSGQGFYIPDGSLDRLKAALNNPEASCEVVGFGDSTGFGSGAIESWFAKLRRMVLAAGVADGGRGIASVIDDADRSGESLSIIQSRTGFETSASGYDFQITGTFRSVAANDVIVFQGWGSRCRLHIGTHPDSGGFTYSIDGGPPVTVESYYAGSYTAIRVRLLDLGADRIRGVNAPHTVTITNLGGALVLPPAAYPGLDMNTIPATSGFPPGTYYYQLTGTTPSGETLPSALASVITPGNQTQVFAANANYTAFKLYRSTSPFGPFGLVSTTAQGGGGYTQIVDTGTAADAGINPPTVSTAGRAGDGLVNVDAEFFRPTGFVLHNMSVSGIRSDQYFGLPSSSSTSASWAGATALGFDHGIPQVYPDAVSIDSVALGGSAYRHPVAAIFALGINDQQGGGADEAAAVAAVKNVTNGVGTFVQFCTGAGVDPIVVVPHYEFALNRQFLAQRMRQAHWAAAAAHGCAILDFNTAVGPYNTAHARFSGVHMNDLGYQAEAQLFFDRIISPLLGV